MRDEPLTFDHAAEFPWPAALPAPFALDDAAVASLAPDGYVLGSHFPWASRPVTSTTAFNRARARPSGEPAHRLRRRIPGRLGVDGRRGV
jgi:hypothetical protein